MDEIEKIIIEELKDLAKQISSDFNKIYFLGMNKAFSINVLTITAEHISPIKEFCAKNNVNWTIMSPSGKGEKGISVVFKNN